MNAPARGIRYPWETPPAEGEAIEVADGILWLRLPLPMALDHVNVYALDDGESWTLIDTGVHSRRSVALWEKILAGPLRGKPVTRLILTHHHPDHVGMAGWFMARGAELVTTRTAMLMSRMLTLDEQERPTPETLRFWRHCGMERRIYDERAETRPFNFADIVHPIPLGYTRIKEGDRLHAAGRDWDVRIGNGHAPEHATLWSTDGTLILAGDQILPSISSNIGVYATEPEADPVSDWIEACERLSTHATTEQLALGGHKLPFRGVPTRLRQLIDNHHGALSRLEDFLSEPRTAAECFPPLFMRRISDGEYGLALVEAMAHCLHLWHEGRAERIVGEDEAWRFRAI
ncbi:Glyoxylase, beta-lactamase superfamily II [Roseivivax halotolerans]|uniref:Glyoxylase, beta-lactamase superfamily II n=1 Tax=Roseivivax halotolerans TaxID=93684 RepID=A0A1I5YPZ6_9RHOB|nr:MBL fold metallo-hydrolase [Roseivivax halotolerans]SFQ46283.1 Glyoxylase, beta-lactamase superfamily II [Roseivivax halotolerans]